MYARRTGGENMKYLFFDIETITAKTINNRIVSFGYVLTDENFNEIFKEDIFINPQEETKTDNNWEWKQIVTQDKEGFKAFYHKIKDLLEDVETIVVGHGTDFDVQYLIDECERYHFEPIDFNYLDTFKISKSLLPVNIKKGLKSLYDELVIHKETYTPHRSLDDACMTKAVFKELLNKARNSKISILENDEFISNSLRSVYGEMESFVRKEAGYFTCNFDIPVIGILVQCTYVRGSEKKKEEFHMYYDYAIDQFFTPKHPKKGSQPANSVLPKHAYDVAQNKAVFKIHKLWDLAKKRGAPQDFFYRKGYSLDNMKFKQIYYALTSYEVYAKYQQNTLLFDFKVALNDNYFKNAIGNKKGRCFDIKNIIKIVHTAETAQKSLLLMAKMKFGNKDKSFPKIQTHELPYSENITYLLAREYVDLLKNNNAEKNSDDTLVVGDKKYIPTQCAFSNNLFSKEFILPVLAEVNNK